MANSEFLEVQENGLSIGLATPAPEVLLTPNIGVIGVGGAGGNVVNNMVTANLGDVSFFVANTDAQALSTSLVADKIQLGITLTQGLGAGAHPEIGRAAAEEASEKIKEYLKGLHLLFITAGMGGGTGTGAAPVIAQIAKDMGILTVGVVSKPFHFEGRKRMQTAESGIVELKKYVDTLIVIPNQNLFRIVSGNTTFADAFKIADNVLCQGVRSVTDLVMNPGTIHLDFSDVKTVLSYMGRTVMGTGEASGENRAELAVEQAISNPLLDDFSIQGAKGVLINILGAENDVKFVETSAIVDRVREELHNDDAEIIFGTRYDEALNGRIRVSVVATGIEENNDNTEKYTPVVPRATEPVVEVPVLTVEETTEKETEQPVEESEAEFPLISEDVSLAKNKQNPMSMGLQGDFSFDDSQADYSMVTELTEASVSQPQLIDEEVPDIAPIIPVSTMPEIKESLNMETRQTNENVKTPRKKNIIEFIIGKSVHSEKEEKTQSQQNNITGNTKTPAYANDYMPAAAAEQLTFSNLPTSNKDGIHDDPFEGVDFPTFLRRR